MSTPCHRSVSFISDFRRCPNLLDGPELVSATTVTATPDHTPTVEWHNSDTLCWRHPVERGNRERGSNGASGRHRMPPSHLHRPRLSHSTRPRDHATTARKQRVLTPIAVRAGWTFHTAARLPVPTPTALSHPSPHSCGDTVCCVAQLSTTPTPSSLLPPLLGPLTLRCRHSIVLAIALYPSTCHRSPC